MSKLLVTLLATLSFNSNAQFYSGVERAMIENARDRAYAERQRDIEEYRALVREQREALREQRDSIADQKLARNIAEMKRQADAIEADTARRVAAHLDWERSVEGKCIMYRTRIARGVVPTVDEAITHSNCK